MNYSFVDVSGNEKTGPIAVTTTEKASCPPSCPFKDNGCYYSTGRGNIHWIKLNDKGITLKELCGKISNLLPNKLWRHDVAGDFSLKKSERVDNRAIVAITKANKGRKGFTYTHCKPGVGNNAKLIKYANDQGFTVNMSANNLRQADEYSALNIGPVVVALPEEQTETPVTPQGRRVVICPNNNNKKIQCIDCQLCQKVNRSIIIGFPAHGIGKNKVSEIARQ